VRFSYLVGAAWIVYIPIMLFAYALSPVGAGVDGLSAALMILLAVEVALIAFVAPSLRANAFLLWMAVFLLLFIAFPFIGYVTRPESFPAPWMPLVHGAASTNAALALVVVGTAFVAGGYAVGAALAVRGVRREARSTVSIAPCYFVALSSIYVVVAVMLVWRYSVYYVGSAPFAGVWWRRLLSGYELTWIALMYVTVNWRALSRTARLAFLLPSATYVLATALLGSRSAVFYIGLLFIQILLVIRGDFRLSMRLLRVLIWTTLLAVVLFPVATRARRFRAELFQTGDRLMLSDVQREVATSVTVADMGALLTPIFQRLNYLDPLVYVMDAPSSVTLEARHYMSFRHSLKSFINIVTPGTPFPEVWWEGANVFGIVYLQNPREFFEEVQGFTAGLSLWGLCFVVFGWLGSLSALFGIGGISGYVYGRIPFVVPGWLVPYLQVWVFVRLLGLLDGFGFDSWLAGVVYEVVPLCLLLIFLWPGVRTHDAHRGLVPKLCPLRRGIADGMECVPLERKQREMRRDPRHEDGSGS
jgi:hypothetical protein